MTYDYETCRSNLEKFIASPTSTVAQRNEDTTRIQLIDRLFLECLGWSRDDILTEESQAGEYADYTFQAPRRVLIVEAKKEGNYFEVPAGKERIEYPIPSLLRDNPNLKAAMEQVAQYCQSRGIPYGAVCNGHQIVAFIANRNDGMPPLEGKALVFPSLNFMLDHFLKLWQALSKPGVEEKKIQSTLIGDVLPELPSKLSAKISHYPGVKGRNVLQADLQIVSELVFEDLARAPELEKQFLEECYCQSGALSQYSLTSKAILQARYEALFGVDTPRPTTVPAVGKGKISAELLAESLSRRPIILIGDVGVGKTSFIRNLIKIEAASLFEKAITLYIDLGAQAALSIDLRAFIPDEIARQLQDGYNVDVDERNFVRGVYHGEIVRFGKGINADLRDTNPNLFKEREVDFLIQKTNNREQHMRDSLGHLVKLRQKQIVIFLDNADQRDDETQQQAFLISQELAASWPATVYVALRPETFHRSMRSGALSGYHAKVFTISPPRIDVVIDKRLQFAIKLCNGDIPIQSLPEMTRVKLTKLEVIIRSFMYSMGRVDDLVEFIDNMCGGNVRVALDLVRNFFGSGHVDTQKILDKSSENNAYTVPLHEFLRAVTYGDYEYYDPDRSIIANLFDVSRLDPKEHFLLPLTLSLLDTSNNFNSESGFIETSKIYDQLQRMGFNPDQIDTSIVRGVRKGLIETSGRQTLALNHTTPHMLRITTTGLYHIIRLCSTFQYIDAIIVDTPILDRDYRDNIRDVRSIEARVDRAEIFREYLNKQWSLLGISGNVFDWKNVSADLQADLRRVRARLP